MPKPIIVAIDPGHGMSNRSPGVLDPGCVHVEDGVRYRECDIVLTWGRALLAALNGVGVQSMLTRPDNTSDAPLWTRAQRAKRAGATHLISIHVNDVENESANGVEVFLSSSRSAALATACLQAMTKNLGLRNRGVKDGKGLSVLSFAGPAVLMEVGFIRNDNDRMRFMDPDRLRRTCRDIAAFFAPSTT